MEPDILYSIANYGSIDCELQLMPTTRVRGVRRPLTLQPRARRCTAVLDRSSVLPYPNTVCTVASLAPACAHLPVPNRGDGP